MYTETNGGWAEHNLLIAGDDRIHISEYLTEDSNKFLRDVFELKTDLRKGLNIEYDAKKKDEAIENGKITKEEFDFVISDYNLDYIYDLVEQSGENIGEEIGEIKTWFKLYI